MLWLLIRIARRGTSNECIPTISRNKQNINIFIPHHLIVGGIMISGWSCLPICPSACPSVCCQSIHILFLDSNLSKYGQIFTKLVMCIDNVEIWFGIANGQISSIFDWVTCQQHDNGGVLYFHVFILVKKKCHIWSYVSGSMIIPYTNIKGKTI